MNYEKGKKSNVQAAGEEDLYSLKCNDIGAKLDLNDAKDSSRFTTMDYNLVTNN